MTFNYDLLLYLVNLSINDVASDSFDGPLFNVLLLDVEYVGQVLVLVIRILKLQRANLHVLLLADHIYHFEFLI